MNRRAFITGLGAVLAAPRERAPTSSVIGLQLAACALHSNGHSVQETEFVKHLSRPERHALQRVVRDRHWKLRFMPQQVIHPGKQRPSSGEDDACFDDVRCHLRRGLLQAGADGAENGLQCLLESLADLFCGDDDGLRQLIDYIATLDRDRATVGLLRIRGSQRDLDLFGPPLADQELWRFLMYSVIASSISSPAIRTELQYTMPARQITATSVVPPPISTIMLPRGS